MGLNMAHITQVCFHNHSTTTLVRCGMAVVPVLMDTNSLFYKK